MPHWHLHEYECIYADREVKSIRTKQPSAGIGDSDSMKLKIVKSRCSGQCLWHKSRYIQVSVTYNVSYGLLIVTFPWHPGINEKSNELTVFLQRKQLKEESV